MVRQLMQAMAALTLGGAMAYAMPREEAVGTVAAGPAASCVAACTAARAACRDGAYRQGYEEVAALRRRAEPPLAASEIGFFMRRERERLARCEAQRAACTQGCGAAGK